MSVSFLRQLLMKEAVKKSAGSSGIMSINKNIAADVDKLLQKYINDAMQQGVDIETLSPDQLKMIVAINSKPTNRVISGTSDEGKAITEKLFGKKGEVVDFPQPKTFKQEIDAMKKSGDIVDPNNLKKNDNVLTREMFQNSNLNKAALDRDRAIKAKARIEEKNEETIMDRINNANNRITEIKKEQEAMYKPKVDTIEETVTYIKTLEPMTALKEANLVIGRKGKYKDLTPEESKKILQDTEDHIFERDIPIDPEDMASGGRAGYYTGGITDVEPSLDDIGHGSDSLMSRTRLMSPGAQATTSTGLNYLLAEDNDNLRIPFAGGGDPKRRAFLKLLATLTGGIAGIKSGFIGLGEGGAKKAVTETVKQSAGSGTPPPYFFKLVEKIKTMGDDTLATQDKATAKKYKDYVLEEDFAGNISITRKGDMDVPGYEEVYMSYSVDDVPIKGKKGSTKVEEYEEVTARPDEDGKMKDVEDGVPEDVIEEATMFEDNMTEFGMTKKADGGRIGFSAGSLAKLGITGSSRRFLEKVFGKEKFKNMIENDPEMHRGMLEVVEMFRKKDKEGLKMYMQKFLPHMDDEMVEDFIVGSGGTEGIEGQLIRLGSGRDYAGKLEMMQKLNNVKKLENLDVTDEMIRKPNSDGGRIGFSGGGIFRAIIVNSAKKKGMKPYEFIKATNYKGLPPEVKMVISPEEYAQLKMGQEQLYTNFIDMAKTRKEFQKNIEGGKNTPARELFEGMEKTMDEQSFVPKTVTSDDIAEMELMVKNRFNKGRKDNANGGIQTMLGE